jgi:hypothetical protein
LNPWHDPGRGSRARQEKNSSPIREPNRQGTSSSSVRMDYGSGILFPCCASKKNLRVNSVVHLPSGSKDYDLDLVQRRLARNSSGCQTFRGIVVPRARFNSRYFSARLIRHVCLSGPGFRGESWGFRDQSHCFSCGLACGDTGSESIAPWHGQSGCGSLYC